MAPETGARVGAAVKASVDELGPGLFGIACSGGADSIALADATIAAAGAAHVVVLTIDHGLSPDSARVAAEVAAWARGTGAAAVVRGVAVARRASIEAAAREARYQALEALVGELGLAWVFTGHTARDQAETVLMRIVRGTGPAGLGGIPKVRGPYVRPLLELRRTEIDAYVSARQLPTWTDPMNADLQLARIRFRARVLPELRGENPALDEALWRLAASAREWTEVIDDLARPFAKLPIDCVALARQPPAVRKRAVALALETHGLGYDAVHLDVIDRLVTSPARGEVGIDVVGARLLRSYNQLTVRELQVPLPHVDLAVPSGPYQLRIWQPGDRMRPLRLRGRSRKLSDLFIDAKVPRGQRQNARVILRTTDRVIVWAEHVGIAFGECPNVIPAPTRLGGSF